MAKKKTVTPDIKRAWLAEHRQKFVKPADAVAALQKQFESALAFPEIANLLAGRPARAGYSKPSKRRKMAGRPKGSVNRKTATSGASWVVSVPGRGRGVSLTLCKSKEEAAQVANAALARGTSPERVGLFQQVDARVETRPTISL